MVGRIRHPIACILLIILFLPTTNYAVYEDCNISCYATDVPIQTGDSFVWNIITAAENGQRFALTVEGINSRILTPGHTEQQFSTKISRVNPFCQSIGKTMLHSSLSLMIQSDLLLVLNLSLIYLPSQIFFSLLEN